MNAIDWSLLFFGFAIGVLASRVWRRTEPEPDERWEFLTLHAAGERYDSTETTESRPEWADSVVRDGSDLWKALCRERMRVAKAQRGEAP